MKFITVMLFGLMAFSASAHAAKGTQCKNLQAVRAVKGCTMKDAEARQKCINAKIAAGEVQEEAGEVAL